MKGGANRDQKKYKCTAGHSDWAHPTTMKKGYYQQSAAILSEKKRTNDSKNEAVLCDTALSPTPRHLKSPRKKKRRRRGKIDTFEGVFGDEEGREEQDNTVSTPTTKNEAWANTELGVVTPAPNKELSFAEPCCLSLAKERESELLKCIVALEKENAYLKKHVMDLNSNEESLMSKVDTLTLETKQLRFENLTLEMKQVRFDKNTTATAAGHDKGFETCRSADDENRKDRVQFENASFSREVAVCIESFVTSSALADKRRFPSSRLAKILVDSILSFEGTDSELAKLYSRQAGEQGSDDGDPLSTRIASAVLNATKKHCRTDKSRAALLVDCMWDINLLDGEVQECMIDKVRNYLRTHVFSPWKILKAMDLAGFNLSLSGLEILRRVDVGTSKYVRGILPSKATMLRVARKLEAAADSLCPFTMIGRTDQQDGAGNLDDGDGADEEEDTFAEGFEFDPLKFTHLLLKSFGVLGVAKERQVELSLTSDGAQLTNTISQVAAGLKLNDIAIRDPFTHLLLLLHEPDSLVQSRNLCFILRVVIAKDSKKTLYGFRPLYGKFESGEIARALGCLPFKMAFPADMKLHWSALDKGGAAKVKENFCFICSCRSSTLDVPQDKSSCVWCTDENNDTSREEHCCYHYPFLTDPDVRSKLVEELDVLTSLLSDDSNVPPPPANIPGASGERKMFVRRPNEVMTQGDTMDIDYQSTTGSNGRIEWARNINAELAGRNMSVMGTLSERQQRLRQRLVNEQRARDISSMLSESEPKEQAMYLALQGVVCILHLENRVGLKSIESILRSGISHARKGVLEWTAGTNSINKRQQDYVRRITHIMQTQILGTPFAPSQWRFPLTEEGNMGTLSMDNNRTRKVMNSIELLIEASFSNSDENKHRLLRCFPHYRAAIKILRKDSDATDEEIRMFQRRIDSWFQDWVKVYGREGCTNYTHMLSSSHVMKYMHQWRCLHRFSQQGWEALNAMIKSYFFRRTNRGGLSKNAKHKSKLLGIARWLQRRLMWYSGSGDALFSSDEENDDEDDSSYDDDNNNNSDSSDNDGSTCTDLDIDEEDFEHESDMDDDDSR